jgi:hypothetical protein
MLAILIILVFFGVLLWGFFNPQPASWVFIWLAVTWGVWLLMTNWSCAKRVPNPNTPPLNLNEEETRIFRKYAAYFYHPFVARQYSVTQSTIQFMCFAWIALMCWHKLWLQAGIFLVVMFLALNVSRIFNIGLFLRYHNARGKLNDELLNTLALVKNVENALTTHREAALNKAMEARRPPAST